MQTEHFNVPLLTDAGAIRKGLITLYVTFDSVPHVINFCNFLPKVRELILVTANKNPIRYSNRKYQLEGVSKLYLNAFRETFPRSGIKKVVVIKGTKDKAEGSEVQAIKGVVRECIPLKTSPKFVIAAEEMNEAIPENQRKNQVSRFEGPVQEDLVNPYANDPNEVENQPEEPISQTDNPEPSDQSISSDITPKIPPAAARESKTESWPVQEGATGMPDAALKKPFQNLESEPKRPLSKEKSKSVESKSKKEDDSLFQLWLLVVGIALVAAALVMVFVMQVKKMNKQNRLDKRMNENSVAEGLLPEGYPSVSRTNIDGTAGVSDSENNGGAQPESFSEKRKRRKEARNRRKEKDTKS